MENIKIITKDNQIKIYFNDVIHLTLRQDNLLGFQSWILGDEHETYWIEYTMKDGVEILTGYDKIDKWKTILELLDKENLFSGKF